MWAGRVGVSDALVLVGHLQFIPESRCRMIRFGGDITWLGWDATAAAAAATHDAIISFAYGMGSSEPPANAFHPRPGSTSPDTPAEDDNLFAPSIAEFNVGKWMQAINS